MMFDTQLSVRKEVMLVTAGECLTILLSVAAPYLLKLAVDLLSQTRGPSARLICILLLFALASGVTGALAGVRHHATTLIVEALAGHITVATLRGQVPRLANTGDDGGPLFGQIERLPYNLQLLIDGILWQVVPLAVQMIISLCVITALVPWPYALAIGLIISAYMAASIIGADRYHEQAEATNETAGRLTALVGDILRLPSRAAFNGNVSGELTSVVHLSNRRLREASSGARSLVTMTIVQSSLLVLGLVALLVLAALDVLQHRLSLGDFVLLHAFILRLTLPLGGFGFLVHQAGRSYAQTRDILLLGEPVRLETSSSVPRPGPAAVHLEGLSFRYGDGPLIIKKVSGSIVAGGLTVLVGPNGSGKSTLARLMAGLLDPTEGKVRVGQECLSNIPPELRHRHILYVPQQIGLFNRTLRDNGLYPPTRLDAAQLLDRLQALRFYADERVPDLDLTVGDRGQALSGGQIQKLEIARLAGVETPAIILDETSSDLDPASELAVIEMLRDERAASTLILVTHRRAIAERADQVLFMSAGRLLFSGTHEALMKRSAYCAYWARSDASPRRRE